MFLGSLKSGERNSGRRLDNPPDESGTRYERVHLGACFRRNGDFDLVVSSHIQTEIERVLSDKFAWSLKRIAEALDPIWEVAHFVTPQSTVLASRDETDNRILECALETGARVGP